MSQQQNLVQGQRLALGQIARLDQITQLLQQTSQELQQSIHQTLEFNPVLEISTEEDRWSAVEIPEVQDDGIDGEEMHAGVDIDISRAVDDGSIFSWEMAENEGEGSDWQTATSAQERIDAVITDTSEANPQEITATRDDAAWDSPAEGESMEFYYPSAMPEDDDSTLQRLANAENPWHDFTQEVKDLARSPLQAQLVEILIGFLDDRGFLGDSLESIAEQCEQDTQELALRSGQSIPHTTWLRELESALALIQSQEPAGIGARDMAECMQLQLARKPVSADTAALQTMVRNHYTDIVAKNWAKIANALSLSHRQVQCLVEQLATLDLQPAQAFLSTPIEYIEPDVSVRKIGHEWQVFLNERLYPPLRINAAMRQAVHRKRNMESMQEKIREAEHFLAALSERAALVLKIARFVVEYQRSYFELGDKGMRALQQIDIAQALGLSESQVSRTLSGKYLQSPRGVIAFQYFVGAAKSATDMGGRVSPTAIGALIRDWVEQEKALNPLRDDDISNRLAEHGISLSRRSVAVYREQLGIAPYHKRRLR